MVTCAVECNHFSVSSTFFLKRLLLVPSSLQFVVHLLVSEEADTDR
jgi:hypothetical protein